MNTILCREIYLMYKYNSLVYRTDAGDGVTHSLHHNLLVLLMLWYLLSRWDDEVWSGRWRHNHNQPPGGFFFSICRVCFRLRDNFIDFNDTAVSPLSRQITNSFLAPFIIIIIVPSEKTRKSCSCKNKTSPQSSSTYHAPPTMGIFLFCYVGCEMIIREFSFQNWHFLS